jgi:hypothetical protein
MKFNTNNFRLWPFSFLMLIALSCAVRTRNEEAQTEGSQTAVQTKFDPWVVSKKASDLGPTISVSYADQNTVGKIVQLDCTSSQKIVDMAFGASRTLFQSIVKEYGSASCAAGTIFETSTQKTISQSGRFGFGLSVGSSGGSSATGSPPVPSLSFTFGRKKTGTETRCEEPANSKYLDDFYFKTIQMESEITAAAGCSVSALSTGTGKLAKCAVGPHLKAAQLDLENRVKKFCLEAALLSKENNSESCSGNEAAGNVCPAYWKTPSVEFGSLQTGVAVSYDTLTGESKPRVFVSFDPGDIFRAKKNTGTLKCIKAKETAQYAKINELLTSEFRKIASEQGCKNSDLKL